MTLAATVQHQTMPCASRKPLSYMGSVLSRAQIVPSGVAAQVTKPAGSSNIGPISTPARCMRNEVLASTLQPPGLTVGERMSLCQLCGALLPHRLATVITTATLSVESNISKGNEGFSGSRHTTLRLQYLLPVSRARNPTGTNRSIPCWHHRRPVQVRLQ